MLRKTATLAEQPSPPHLKASFQTRLARLSAPTLALQATAQGSNHDFDNKKERPPFGGLSFL